MTDSARPGWRDRLVALVEHPAFLNCITGLILFMGRVVDPSVT